MSNYEERDEESKPESPIEVPFGLKKANYNLYRDSEIIISDYVSLFDTIKDL